MYKVAKFGWIPDRPDHRDFLFDKQLVALAALPDSVDLRQGFPVPYDQGQIGSCVGNAVGGAYHYDELKQKKTNVFTPSRLFIYYNGRMIEQTTSSDSGLAIRDGIKAVVKWGVCNETIWPYVEKKVFSKPVTKAYKDALPHKVSQYMRVNNSSADDIKHCLAAGNPVVFGMTVYDSFESDETAKTGIVQMPGRNESEIGGHSMLIVGYDSNKKYFIVRNSWGEDWGDNGYCYVPESYLTDTNLADDFWTILAVP